MINKFKDFLKAKLSRKKSNDLSDQEEILEEEVTTSSEDQTGDVPTGIPSTNLKDKFGEVFSKFKYSLPTKRLKTLKLPQGISESAPLLSPSLSRNIEQFLSRASREPIHQASAVIIVCGVVYTLGTITALVLKGTPQMDSPKSFAVNIQLDKDFNAMTLNQVKAINIFRTGSQAAKKNLANTKCEEAQQETSLPLKLVNTIVLQDSVKSLASVQVRGARELREVREGDKIDNLAQIFKITRLEILIKNLESGVCESIASTKLNDMRSAPITVMSPSASRDFRKNKKLPGIENVGNKFTIQKALLEEKMKDIASILTQAKAVKIQNPDGSISFKMTEMDPNGIFGYLGLQDGDIITAIDGKAIYDLNEVMNKFGRIKNLDQLSLGIKREGMESTQEYSIKK